MRGRWLFTIPLVLCVAAALVVLPAVFAGRDHPPSEEQASAPQAASPSANAPPPLEGERWRELAANLEAQKNRTEASAPQPRAPRYTFAEQVNSRSDSESFYPAEADFVWRTMTKAFPFPLPPGAKWPGQAPAWMRYDIPQSFQEGVQEASGTDYWYCSWLDAGISMKRKPRPGLTEDRVRAMLAAEARAPRHWAKEQAAEMRERSLRVARGSVDDWARQHDLFDCNLVLLWPAGPEEIPAPPPGG